MRSIKNNKGVSLAELLISAIVLIFVFASMLVTYVRCIELNEISRNKMSAIMAAKSQMENIRNTTFADIITTFHETTFLNSGLDDLTTGNVRGVSYVEQEGANPNLLRVTVTVCWRQKNGRIIGEDTNLNGQLDAGEDVSGNPESITGLLDSPVTLVSFVYDT